MSNVTKLSDYKTFEDKLQQAERQQLELEKEVNSMILENTSNKASSFYTFSQYLVVAVSCLLVYILPIWLGIPVILGTMWLTSK